jgi:ABC-2 type transport system permease protein
VQGMFPFVFVVLFLSSAFFPQNLMLEPAKTIADYNPLSFIVDGIRDSIVFGFSSSVMLDAVLSVLGIATFGLLMSAAALRRRVRTGG